MVKQNRKYGWRGVSLPDHRDYIYEPTIAKLPKEVDLRIGMSPVYNQGALGACTSHAIAAHLDYNRKKQGEQFIFPSRLFIYYNERSHDGTVNEDAGSTIRESVKTIKKNGACPESEWPYDIRQFREMPSRQCYADAVNYEDITYYKLPQTQIAFQSCLAEGYPFVGGIAVYESFESQQASETGVIPMPKLNEQMLGGHALCFCGYCEIAGELYFILRNSWGESWGDNGYGYIPATYLLNHNLASDFWVLKRVK